MTHETRLYQVDAFTEESFAGNPAAVAQSRHYWLAEMASESAVRVLEPSFEHIRELPTAGIVATARAPEGREYDFVSRFFAPQAGVPEDPVTGSAHCVLAPWWAERPDFQAKT